MKPIKFCMIICGLALPLASCVGIRSGSSSVDDDGYAIIVLCTQDLNRMIADKLPKAERLSYSRGPKVKRSPDRTSIWCVSYEGLVYVFNSDGSVSQHQTNRRERDKFYESWKSGDTEAVSVWDLFLYHVPLASDTGTYVARSFENEIRRLSDGSVVTETEGDVRLLGSGDDGDVLLCVIARNNWDFFLLRIRFSTGERTLSPIPSPPDIREGWYLYPRDISPDLKQVVFIENFPAGPVFWFQRPKIWVLNTDTLEFDTPRSVGVGDGGVYAFVVTKETARGFKQFKTIPLSQ